MSGINKVLWADGQFLRPQHFQQQDNYHEQQLHRMAQRMHPYSWGVDRLEVDRDALGSGVLRLLELSLVFADGEHVQAPGNDALPPAIDLSALRAGPDSIDTADQAMLFHAVLPALKPCGGNVLADGDASCASAGAGSTRYLQRHVATSDLFTGAGSADIGVLSRIVRLVPDGQQGDACLAVPLLKIRRRSSGGFEIDADFIAPSLSLRSAPTLFLQLRRLLDALQAKIAALQGHHREPSRHVVEYRSGDMASFWLLHSASQASAELGHFFHHPGLHPERLYQALLGLAGSLLSYSKSHVLADLHAYDHANPAPCFASLHAIIRDLLDTVISSKAFAIVLQETRPCYHHGALASEKIDERTMLFLAVSADVPARELVELVPLRFKIGAPDDVDKFVLSAMPGVRMQHAAQVPAAVPVRPDMCYFSLDSKGAMYERMLQSQTISIYTPSGMRDLRLELIAVAP